MSNQSWDTNCGTPCRRGLFHTFLLPLLLLPQVQQNVRERARLAARPAPDRRPLQLQDALAEGVDLEWNMIEYHKY